MSGANINEVELRSWIPEEFSHSAGAPNLSWAGLDRVLNLAFLLFFFICKKVVVHGTSFFIFLEISGTTLGPTIRGEFFLPEICLCQKSKKKIMKEIAKKKSKL